MKHILRNTILGLALVVSGMSANAQTTIHCDHGEALESQVPGYSPRYEENFMTIWRNYEQNVMANAKFNDEPTIIIPVVVHVISAPGSAQLVTNEQVIEAIRQANLDHQKKDPDSVNVLGWSATGNHTQFANIHGESNFEFRLARRDPSGNPSNGIIHVTSSTTTAWSDNSNHKSISRWDPTRYLNIWVVQTIASGAGGYSYRPQTFGNPGSYPAGILNVDGVVCLASQFGSRASFGTQLLAARTNSHEIGHYMGLPHTWGNSNSPGSSSNCSTFPNGDGVADTPQTPGVGTFGCNRSQQGCVPGTIANVENIMDYSDCPRMFTIGQGSLMRFTAQNYRFQMLNSANLNATGVGDVALKPHGFVYTPQSQTVCVGSTASFRADVYNWFPSNLTPTFTWTALTGSSQPAQVGQNATIAFNTPGVHQVRLVISNAIGADTHFRSVSVVGGLPRITTTDLVSFEGSWPVVDPNDANANYEIVNPVPSQPNAIWRQTQDAAYNGSSSLRLDARTFNSPRTVSFITPAVEIGNSPTMRFRFAYASPRTVALTTDRLVVEYSADCGVNWFQVNSATGNQLVSATGGTPVTSQFIPMRSEWRERNVNINSLAGTTVKFRFSLESQATATGQSGQLYIDSLKFNGVLSVNSLFESNTKAAIYPNPFSGNTTIEYTLLNNENVGIEILDVVGRSVAATNLKQSAGRQTVELREITAQPLAKGVYTLRLRTSEGMLTRKLVAQ